MMNKTIPLQRKSLSEEVADQLRTLIISGAYPVNSQLPTEPELMQQFGVGRSSIREAVRILANNGMLRVQQGVGTFVASATCTGDPLNQRLQRAPFEDLNEVKLLLEMKIAEKAATNRTQKDIEKMKACLKKRYQCGLAKDKEGCIQADINFHTAVAVASGNEIILELYKVVATHMKASFMQRHADAEPFVISQDLHDALLQSIIDKDPEQALFWATRINTRVP